MTVASDWPAERIPVCYRRVVCIDFVVNVLYVNAADHMVACRCWEAVVRLILPSSEGGTCSVIRADEAGRRQKQMDEDMPGDLSVPHGCVEPRGQRTSRRGVELTAAHTIARRRTAEACMMCILRRVIACPHGLTNSRKLGLFCEAEIKLGLQTRSNPTWARCMGNYKAYL